MADVIIEPAEADRLAAPETAALLGPLVPPNDWLYYRVYVAGHADMERLLERVIGPEVAGIEEEIPGLRWFFLRFLDRTGLHLRLRLRADLAGLCRIEQRLDGAFASLQGTGPRAAAAGVLCRCFGKFVYQREADKFGAGPGIDLAEQVFQAGSRTALACLGDRQRSLRVAYAAAHIRAVLEPMALGLRRTFLHQYAWYWAGGPAPRGATPGGPGWRTNLAAVSGADGPARAARLTDQARQVMTDPGAAAAIDGYAGQLWQALRSEARRAVPRTDHFLLFHHLHLMNNRLGVFPMEEARIARLLWIGSGP